MSQGPGGLTEHRQRGRSAAPGHVEQRVGGDAVINPPVSSSDVGEVKGAGGLPLVSASVLTLTDRGTWWLLSAPSVCGRPSGPRGDTTLMTER